MNMTPRFQKLALLAHLTFSLGWLGAVIAYLALAIAGVTSHDVQMMRGLYLSMELIGWFVIVPLGLATLLSGLVQSLGTRWGLFRHWWIVAKLLLTIVAIAILLKHMQDVSRTSRLTAQAMLSSANFRPELIHAGGGLLVLLAAAALSVLKPWGMTAYGRRVTSRSYQPSRASDVTAPMRRPARESLSMSIAPRWAHIIGIHAAVLVLLFAILHITDLHHR